MFGFSQEMQLNELKRNQTTLWSTKTLIEMKVQAFIYKKIIFTFLSSHHCVKMQSQFLNVRNENDYNTNLAHTKM